MALFPRTGDFAPLFRFLDDYDVHRSSRGGETSIRSFAPRFDVRETKDAYYLDGELAGISQKEIEIEFSEPQTLVIKGHVQREYQFPEGEEEGDSNQQQKKESSSAVRKTGDSNKQVGSHKYWVEERSVGEFHRTFNFPAHVNQDNVKASLKNGILSVVVPKAAPPTSKKINVE